MKIMKISRKSKIKALSEIAEMKRIYSAVEPVLVQTEPVCVLITSAVPAEGKTLVTAAMSTLAAQKLGKRVLAVDLNCYRPVLHKCFGLSNDNLQEFRRGLRVDDAVLSTEVSNLDVLTSVQTDSGPQDLYCDECLIAMEIIRQAREAYDLIFVDSSSVFPANRHMIDPVGLAGAVDRTIIVTLANVTPRQQVKRALVSLETAGAYVLGVIVNQWKNPIAWNVSDNFIN